MQEKWEGVEGRQRWYKKRERTGGRKEERGIVRYERWELQCTNALGTHVNIPG